MPLVEYNRHDFGFIRMRHIPRFFVGADLVCGCEIAVEGDARHHILHVLRLREGGVVRLFNGRDGEFEACLLSENKRGVNFLVISRLRRQERSGGAWLIAGILKRDRMGLLVEKATELRVAVILPVITEHAARIRLDTDKLSLRAVTAAQQCERLDVPVILPPVLLGDLAATLPSERVLYVAMERGRHKHLWTLLCDNPPSLDEVALLVGPAGGFSEAEAAFLQNCRQASLCSLGDSLLRSETASLMALSLFYGVSQASGF